MGACEALFYDRICVFQPWVLGNSVHQENGLNDGDIGRIMVASSAGIESLRECSRSDSTGAGGAYRNILHRIRLDS